MKIVICYFSGTGNTRKIAECFAEYMREHDNDVRVFSIDGLTLNKKLPDETVEEIKTCDLLGFGYPVYAFNAPPIALTFAKKLPRLAQPKRAFIFNSSGEPLRLNNISSLKLCGILRRRRIEVTNEYHYCMPYNIMFRHSDEMAHKMFETAKRLVPLDAREILEGQKHRLKRIKCGNTIAWVMRCEQWGGQLNGRMYRVSKECVHCGKCVTNCPTHNIRITEKGKFKFGGKCLMCMRCAHLCPQNAIRIGMFNGWKVNGPYTFVAPKTDEKKQHYNRMLTKAYAQYFENAEKRIADADRETTNRNDDEQIV